MKKKYGVFFVLSLAATNVNAQEAPTENIDASSEQSEATTSSPTQEKKEVDLGAALKGVELEDVKVPKSVAEEKLYVVHSRYVNLKNRHEVAVSGARTFVGDSFITSHNTGLSYNYHLNNRWSLGVAGTYYFNEFNSSGKNLVEEQGVLPKVNYLKSSYDVFASFRPLYGKVRWSLERSIHFDQYISLGAARINTSAGGDQNAALLDVGLHVWIGKNMTAKLGLKDLFYKKASAAGGGLEQNLQLHLDFGFLFGG